MLDTAYETIAVEPFMRHIGALISGSESLTIHSDESTKRIADDRWNSVFRATSDQQWAASSISASYPPHWQSKGHR